MTVLDNLSTGRRENLEHNVDAYNSGKLRFIEGDIRKELEVIDAFENQSYEAVFHLAAQTSVKKSVDFPGITRTINVAGSENLVNIMCSASNASGKPIPRFIFASSAAVYGTRVPVPTSETADCIPISPYGESKLAFERSSALDGVPAVFLRFSNVFGPGQTAMGEAAVVPSFIRAARTDKEITIYGTGDQTRDLVYVDDVAHAMIHAWRQGLEGAYNVSSGVERSINSLVGLLQDLKGSPLNRCFKPAREGDIERSCLDSSKLQNTGWTSRTPFVDGLTQTFHAYSVTK